MKDNATNTQKKNIAELGGFKISLLNIVAVCMLVFIVATAILAPIIAPYDPSHQDLDKRLLKPGAEHLLGTDHLGRDVLSRVMYGGQVSLIVGVSSVLIAGAFGVILGLTAGFFGGITDVIISRITDIQLSIPYMLLAIAVVMIAGSGLLNTIFVLVLVRWVVYARLARGMAISLREREYVTAAFAVGARRFRILFKHLLPNSLNPIIVIASVEVANMILFESGLSFLGLGVQPPFMSWGQMLADGRDYLTESWWVAVFPGAAITLTIFTINQVGDWLRDVLDPRTQ